MKRILFAFMFFTLSIIADPANALNPVDIFGPLVMPGACGKLGCGDNKKEPAGNQESIVECFVFAKLNDQDPNPVEVTLGSYTINSNAEFAIIGDETCSIAGKFRVLLDPANHGINISVADISNGAGQIDDTACTEHNNPPFDFGFPAYKPILSSLYQQLPKDLKAREVSTHGFTGLQYINGRDGKGELQLFCK